MLKHPGEHVVRWEADVLGEHAEHEPVHEVRDHLWIVALFAKGVRELREGLRRMSRERLPALSGTKALGVRHGPLELVPDRGVREVLEDELAALEAVRLPGRIGYGRRPFSEHPAEIDEVLLRGRPFLECRGSPLRDEFAWAHALSHFARIELRSVRDHPLFALSSNPESSRRALARPWVRAPNRGDCTPSSHGHRGARDCLTTQGQRSHL